MSPTPAGQLALLALATQIGNRIGGLCQVLAGAAGSDPEIAELYGNSSKPGTTTSSAWPDPWPEKAR